MNMTAAQFDRARAAGLSPFNHSLDGFAAACYEGNSADELLDGLTATSDVGDMAAWSIDAQGWHAAIRAALETAMADAQA